MKPVQRIDYSGRILSFERKDANRPKKIFFRKAANRETPPASPAPQKKSHEQHEREWRVFMELIRKNDFERIMARRGLRQKIFAVPDDERAQR